MYVTVIVESGVITDVLPARTAEAAIRRGRNLARRHGFDADTDDIQVWQVSTRPELAGGKGVLVASWNTIMGRVE